MKFISAGKNKPMTGGEKQMNLITSLSYIAGWMRDPITGIWRSAEPFLMVVYLAFLLFIAIWIWRQDGKGARILAGAIFVLLTGEAYRLVPQIVAFVNPKSPMPDGEGIGRVLSYISMAGFFLLLELYRQQRFGKSETREGGRLENAVFILFGCIVAEGLVRFNGWMEGNGAYLWLIIRSLLLAALGILVIRMWVFTAKDDRTVRHMPMAVGLIFAFYIPSIVLEQAVPELSVLMIPRTAALVWLVTILRGTAVVRGTGYSFKTYIRRYWTLYLLLLIPIAFFALFRYYPMSYISQAFKENNILMHPWEVSLAKEGGLEWFSKAFTDNTFGTALFNTVFLNILDLIIGMPMPIIMALLLNELAFPKFKRLTQTVLYLPHFLSWVIISSISLRLFGTNDGIINKLFHTTIPYMEAENHWRVMYIVLGIWKECGWNTIIYLAALTGINAELYEAAEVDGAGRFQKIWHVTLPGIRSTIIVLLIMNLGRILGSEFDRPYTLSNLQVKQVSTTISIFVYERGLKGNQYSLSTAVGLFQSVVCVIFLIASNTLAKKFGERGIW